MGSLAGIARHVEAATAQHYINAPASARMLVLDAEGRLRSLARSGTDDPLLYAYEVLDTLVPLLPILGQLQRICKAITDATPDQLVDSGANPCP